MLQNALMIRKDAPAVGKDGGRHEPGPPGTKSAKDNAKGRKQSVRSQEYVMRERNV